MTCRAAGFDQVALTSQADDGETITFTGPRCEQEADHWLRRHVQLAPTQCWQWSVNVRLELEGGLCISFEQAIQRRRGQGTVRDAAIAHCIRHAQDAQLPPARRRTAAVMAERLRGYPLDTDVDWFDEAASASVPASAPSARVG